MKALLLALIVTAATLPAFAGNGQTGSASLSNSYAENMADAIYQARKHGQLQNAPHESFAGGLLYRAVGIQCFDLDGLAPECLSRSASAQDEFTQFVLKKTAVLIERGHNIPATNRMYNGDLPMLGSRLGMEYDIGVLECVENQNGVSCLPPTLPAN